jgi:hypothetical protein
MPHQVGLTLHRQRNSHKKQKSISNLPSLARKGDEEKIREHNNIMRKRIGREPDFTVFNRGGFYASPPSVRAEFYYFDDWYFDKYSVNYYYTRFANDQERPDQELHCAIALDNFEQVIKAYNEMAQKKFKSENK